MSKKIRLNVKRRFSEEFKRSRVQQYESGEYSVREICELYQIASALFYRWIHKYSLYNKGGYKVVEMSKSSEKKVKDLQSRIKELEQIVGQKQLQVDYLEKLIELAQEAYGIDVKKNSNTSPSSGSKSKGRQEAPQ